MLIANTVDDLYILMSTAVPGEMIGVTPELLRKITHKQKPEIYIKNDPTLAVEANFAQNFEQSWNNIKNEGEQHHKTGGVEPIDLYKDGEMLRDFAICSIMKYAFRNRRQLGKPINSKDLGKIIHFTKMLGFIVEKEAACGKKTE